MNSIQTSGGSPYFSIVVAVLNNARTLERCITSIANQRFPYKELIVIDGRSTDGSVDILRRHQTSLTFWVSEPDHGIYDAWNKGLKHAHGAWICFLGADDYLWNEDVLTSLVTKLNGIPDKTRVVYGSVAVVNSNGAVTNIIGEPWVKARVHFFDTMSIPHPGLMHRKSLFADRGDFDTSFRIAGDYELLLRELKTCDAFFIPDIVVVGMQTGGISSLHKNARLSLLEARKAQRMHGLGCWPGRHWIVQFAKVLTKSGVLFLVGDRLGGRIFELLRVLRRGKSRNLR